MVESSNPNFDFKIKGKHFNNLIVKIIIHKNKYTLKIDIVSKKIVLYNIKGFSKLFIHNFLLNDMVITGGKNGNKSKKE